jgi:large subunit ribosomal protein L23
MDIRKIIKKPLITERTSALKEQDNKYCFKCDKDATKGQIKEAVEKLFNVKVENVHTSIVPGKERRQGAHSGYQSDWKKAIVKIQKGQEIQLVEEA